VETDRAADDSIASSVTVNRVRFLLGLVLVTIGAGGFAVAFRASLAAVWFIGATRPCPVQQPATVVDN
jgi:hypothetical protein